MKKYAAAVIAFLALPTATAHAQGEWHAGPGVAIVKNIDEVVDVYKQNLSNQGKPLSVDKPLPVGISFDVHYQYDTGLRLGAGLGPFFRLTGDASHFELPVNGTAGYTFLPDKDASPYAKAGLVYHISHGDFFSKSTPGLYAGFGLELARNAPFSFTAELSIDQSKVELDTVCGPKAPAGCVPGKIDLHVFETALTFFVKF